jgi:beta-glucosidase
MGGDRKLSLGLRPRDVGLIRAVCAANPRTAVVLIGGGMIMVEEWKSAAPAILMAYYPGMEGGTAIAQTLFGDSNPGGKLPFAVPKRESDLPAVDWEAEKIAYGYYSGYRKLRKDGATPSFPYGFGLSYTSFALSDPVFEASSEEIRASCTLRNSGSRRGDEVVQLYVGFSRSKADRPVKTLLGFARVGLDAGEARRVTIRCPAEKLRLYDPDAGTWALERMEYEAYIGTSSADEDALRGSFTL